MVSHSYDLVCMIAIQTVSRPANVSVLSLESVCALCSGRRSVLAPPVSSTHYRRSRTSCIGTFDSHLAFAPTQGVRAYRCHEPRSLRLGVIFLIEHFVFQKPDRFGEPRLPLFAFASLLLHENGLTSCWNFPDTMALGIFFAERSRPVAGLGSHCRTVLAPQNVSYKWRCVKFARSCWKGSAVSSKIACLYLTKQKKRQRSNSSTKKQESIRQHKPWVRKTKT